MEVIKMIDCVQRQNFTCRLSPAWQRGAWTRNIQEAAIKNSKNSERHFLLCIFSWIIVTFFSNSNGLLSVQSCYFG